MKMGQTTTPEKTPVDWPTPTPAPAPTGMSSNTRNLLIGGAVIAAGLLIYSMTKKK